MAPSGQAVNPDFITDFRDARFTGGVWEELPDPFQYNNWETANLACGAPLPENQEAARAWFRKYKMSGIGWMVFGVAVLAGIIAFANSGLPAGRNVRAMIAVCIGGLIPAGLPSRYGWLQFKAGQQTIAYADGKMSYARAAIIPFRRWKGGGGGGGGGGEGWRWGGREGWWRWGGRGWWWWGVIMGWGGGWGGGSNVTHIYLRMHIDI